MTLRNQLAFWFLALLTLIAVLYVLSDILLPFVAGMALAYMLDPMADRLEKIGASRIVATSIIIGVALLIFTAVLFLLVPLIGQQIGQLAAATPGAIRAIEAELIERLDWLRELAKQSDMTVEGQLAGFAKTGIGWLAKLAGGILSGGVALVGLLSLLVVTPVVAFYLLVDWDNIVAKVDSWLPLEHRAAIREISTDIDRAMAGFVRGQSTVCLILGSFYALTLTLAGLKFGLLIGLLAGLISFIPYVGSVTGFVAAVGMAVIQTWPSPDFSYIALVAAIFGVGQFLEGNIISPRLVGNSVGLHPVWLMFALFAFGSLFGFVGMLLAVPLAAAIGVVLRFLLKRYLHSSFYRGANRDTVTQTGKGPPAT